MRRDRTSSRRLPHAEAMLKVDQTMIEGRYDEGSIGVGLPEGTGGSGPPVKGGEDMMPAERYRQMRGRGTQLWSAHGQGSRLRRRGARERAKKGDAQRMSVNGGHGSTHCPAGRHTLKTSAANRSNGSAAPSATMSVERLSCR